MFTDRTERSHMRRMRRFFIAQKMIVGYPDAVLEALRNVIVLRGEYQFDRMGWEYLGISMDFEPLGEGLEAPYHEVDYDTLSGQVVWRSHEALGGYDCADTNEKNRRGYSDR